MLTLVNIDEPIELEAMLVRNFEGPIQVITMILYLLAKRVVLQHIILDSLRQATGIKYTK